MLFEVWDIDFENVLIIGLMVILIFVVLMDIFGILNVYCVLKFNVVGNVVEEGLVVFFVVDGFVN